jgi:TPP-dependent pyruvate/acetoin dehydrogenase alpha subunit
LVATSSGSDWQLGDLAEPSALHDPIDVGGQDPALLLFLLEQLQLIRRAEETIAEWSARGDARTPCHLAIGQEACALGVATELDIERDRVFGAHRSHGHYLALGGDLTQLFAEVLGKAAGCSRGMGGSMHLVAPEVGLLGTVPIVGATIPMAVGAALAAVMEGSGGLAVTFFGDGATEEGIFHESINLAAVRGLPVLFVCENNLFSSHLHIALRQPYPSIARFGAMNGVAWDSLDGNDVLAVRKSTRAAVERARAGGGPTLLELVTYRWRGHVGPREDLDVGVARAADLPMWKGRDPIRRFEEGLTRAGLLAASDREAIRSRVEQRITAAALAAQSSPYPEPDATMRYMYSGARA